jgi:hypothetical protein
MSEKHEEMVDDRAVADLIDCIGSAQPIYAALPLGAALMPRTAGNDGLDKFQRYRANRRAAGMKLLRLWVPNPRAPGFRQDAERQAQLLRDAPEERAALDFIDAAADWGDTET